MLICSMLFQQPPEHVLGNLFALLGDISVDADVKIWAIGILACYFVEKVGEPEKIVLVADHPVAVNASVVFVW